jgi:hypothetical protein
MGQSMSRAAVPPYPRFSSQEAVVQWGQIITGDVFIAAAATAAAEEDDQKRITHHYETSE